MASTGGFDNTIKKPWPDFTRIAEVLFYWKEQGILLFRPWTPQDGSQIGSTVDKAFAFQVDGLGFNSPSGYKVGRPGHSKYVWVGQYEPSCLKFPPSVLEDNL